MKGIFQTSMREADSVFSFFFESEASFAWAPGQYTELKLSSGKRMFTIASFPAEEGVRITTRIPEVHSDFKKELLSLKAGDVVELGRAKGRFLSDLEFPAVFLAGGIGVTPFRSFLLSKRDAPCSLIHVSSDTPPLFSREFFEAGMQVAYPEKLEDAIVESGSSTYAVAGPEAFVWNALRLLREQGVPSERIRREEFTGY